MGHDEDAWKVVDIEQEEDIDYGENTRDVRQLITNFENSRVEEVVLPKKSVDSLPPSLGFTLEIMPSDQGIELVLTLSPHASMPIDTGPMEISTVPHLHDNYSTGEREEKILPSQTVSNLMGSCGAESLQVNEVYCERENEIMVPRNRHVIEIESEEDMSKVDVSISNSTGTRVDVIVEELDIPVENKVLLECELLSCEGVLDLFDPFDSPQLQSFNKLEHIDFLGVDNFDLVYNPRLMNIVNSLKINSIRIMHLVEFKFLMQLWLLRYSKYLILCHGRVQFLKESLKGGDMFMVVIFHSVTGVRNPQKHSVFSFFSNFFYIEFFFIFSFFFLCFFVLIFVLSI